MGEAYLLPKGSIALDYIYRVHSEIVQYCQSIWVNGRLVDYRQLLQAEDLVSMETSSRARGTQEITLQPSEEWLDEVKTSAAKSHIKRALRQQKASRHKGREILDKLLDIELQAYHLEIPPEAVDKFLWETARRFNYHNLTALYNAIASPKHSIKSSSLRPTRSYLG